MLVLTRKKGESLVFDDIIQVHVSDVSVNKVSLAIDCPRDIKIWRGELGAFQTQSQERLINWTCVSIGKWVGFTDSLPITSGFSPLYTIDITPQGKFSTVNSLENRIVKAQETIFTSLSSAKRSCEHIENGFSHAS